MYCKTRIFSAQFILALLAHSFNCAKISSALNVHIVYMQKNLKKTTGTIWKRPMNSVIYNTGYYNN